MRWLEVFAVAALGLSLSGCASDGAATRRAVDAETKEASDLQVKLGRGYMDRGELEVALERLQRAIEIDPRNVDAYTLLGVLHVRINRPEKAEGYYRKAAQIAPENGEVNNNLGAFLCSIGQFAQAEPYFLKAVDDPFYRTPDDALANAGVCAVKANDMVKGEQYFRRVLELKPNHAVALFELARMSYLTNNDMRARAFLQRLEAVTPEGPIMLDLGQRIETRIGDSAAANRYSERLRANFPDYVPDPSLGQANQP